MGSLEAKRRRKPPGFQQVPPSATDTLCSRKTEPPASVLVGHCACWDFVLSWGQVPPWMVTSPFVTQCEPLHEHTSVRGVCLR